VDPFDLSAMRSRGDALADGFSDHELGRLTGAGEWRRLRRGAYWLGDAPDDRIAQHRLLVHATVRGLKRPAVVSHQSAAVLLGLPLWRVSLQTVHVTRRPRASSDVGRLLRCHVARLRDDDVVEVDGVEVTSPTRTALDLARSLPFESAVVAVDGALHERLVDPHLLRERLIDIVGTPGSRSAARVVGFADRRSESVGESRSRVLFQRLGLHPSTLQLPIRTADGTRLGRVDFGWEEERVVGEFDGRIKYGRLLRPGQDPGDAVFEEKRREDAIRSEGWGMVRWTWADIEVPLQLQRRLQKALGAAA
jgi:hypothetical protein